MNEAAFNQAVDEVSDVAARLMQSLVTLSPPRNREVEQAKVALSSAGRFGKG
ncbi:DUF2277 family protein [Acinetobacter baumannii]